MATSKKDYEAAAQAVRDSIPDEWLSKTWPRNSYNNGVITTGVLIANGLADYFEQGNPRFDRERFLAACGVAIQRS